MLVDSVSEGTEPFEGKHTPCFLQCIFYVVSVRTDSKVCYHSSRCQEVFGAHVHRSLILKSHKEEREKNTHAY